MQYFPPALENLVEQFARLPGVGVKSAQRLAFHVLSLPEEDAAAFARRMAECGTRRFVLAHLSRENNTPARALHVMETALSDLDVSVEVAPRDELSDCYTPEVIACRR